MHMIASRPLYLSAIMLQANSLAGTCVCMCACMANLTLREPF
jgi:hypothetical protein